jgi:hypothetical protein
MFSKIVVAVLSLGLLIPAGNVMAQDSSSPAAPVTAQDKSTPASTTSPASSPELLTPDEAQSLAERSVEPPREVSGGSLTTQQLTYVVIALAAAVLVLIAVR